MSDSRKDFNLLYTADSHGELKNISCCSRSYHKDENTLIIDGGDILQGSALMYYLYRIRKDSEKGISVAAEIMNACGYDFITLGNHDFSFGKKALEQFLTEFNGKCLCANVIGLENVFRTAVVTLGNGLTIGLTGIVTPLVPLWEPSENTDGIEFKDAFDTAAEALSELHDSNPDYTVCIYHGGYETSPSEENQGVRIARELDFDVLLTAHQHISLAGKNLFGTFTCQTADKCLEYIRITASDRYITSEAVCKDDISLENAEGIIETTENEMRLWLDAVIGHLDVPLKTDSHIRMATEGSLIANFFNTVQLEATGADISCTSLSNSQQGIPEEVTAGDVLRAYVFPNTLNVIKVDRNTLKFALERCAEYFDRDAEGKITISKAFTSPAEQHYNYDYYSGIEYEIDTRLPYGQRVSSIRFRGKELEDGISLKLCLNNYRASGTGGYQMFPKCETLHVFTCDVQELILDYFRRNSNVCVDRTKYISVV